MKSKRLLVLTKYGRLGASSRLRVLQFLPRMEELGFVVEVSELVTDEMLLRLYDAGAYSRQSLMLAYAKRILKIFQVRNYDLIWIEKEALPWIPVWLEKRFLKGRPYIVDYDDAVFHNYDQHPNLLVRKIFGQRIDKIMADASLVIAGNAYLAKRARNAGASRILVVPTVIEFDRYRQTSEHVSETPRIVWIGSPSTVKYIENIRGALQQVSTKYPFVLRIIGGGEVRIPGVEVEVLPWSEDTEIRDIATCDIGIMPLDDSNWTRGKCGYKLIQCMACGLPVVASPVGVNGEIVQEGKTGYLARDEVDWVNAFCRLIPDAAMRLQMGRNGRAVVRQMYSVDAVFSLLSQAISDTAQIRHD